MIDLDLAETVINRPHIGERTPSSHGIDWIALVAEPRAAREIVQALLAFQAMPGHDFDDTPQTGRDVGAALAAYLQTTGEATADAR